MASKNVPSVNVARMMDINLIKVKQEDNVRAAIAENSLPAEFVETFKVKGVMQAVTIDSKNYLRYGFRRYFGAKQAGLKMIPVVVKDEGVQEDLASKIIENCAREDLTSYEKAYAYWTLKGLMEQESGKKVTVENLVKMAPGVSIPQVYQWMRIIEGFTAEGKDERWMVKWREQPNLLTISTLDKVAKLSGDEQRKLYEEKFNKAPTDGKEGKEKEGSGGAQEAKTNSRIGKKKAEIEKYLEKIQKTNPAQGSEAKAVAETLRWVLGFRTDEPVKV